MLNINVRLSLLFFQNNDYIDATLKVKRRKNNHKLHINKLF